MPQSISPLLNMNLSRPVRFPHASSIRKIAVWQLLVDRMPHAKSVDAHLSRACVPTPFSRFLCPQERASPVRSTRAAPEPPGSPGVGGSEVRGFSVKGPPREASGDFAPVSFQMDHPRHGARAAGPQRGPAGHRPMPAVAQRGQTAPARRSPASAERKVSGAFVACRTPCTTNVVTSICR